MQKILGIKNLQQQSISTFVKEEFSKFGNFTLPRKDVLIVSGKNKTYESKNFTLVSTEDLVSGKPNIIFNTYQHLGKESFAQFYGGWSIVIIEDNRIILACDQSGRHNLHYYYSDKYFLFSSSLKDLISFSMVQKKPNIPYVTKNLSPKKKMYHTAFENIYFVPRGHFLIFDSISRQEKLKPFWFPQNLSPLKFSKIEDYYECFRDVYTNVIHNITKKEKIATTLSSGLDSSSVTAIAAQKLQKENRLLSTFTWVPAYEAKGIKTNKIINEKPLVEFVLQNNPNIIPHFINAKDKLLIPSIKDRVLLGESRVNGNCLWIQEMLEVVKRQNIDCLLIAEGGNRTVSKKMDPYFLNNFSNSKSLWKKVLKKHVPFFNHPLIRELRHKLKNKKNIWNTVIEWDVENFCKKKLLAYIFSSGRIWNYLGDAYDIEIIDPTMDQKVIEFCLRIPQRVYGSRDLIRKGCQHILPDEILKNNKRGLQANDLLPRFLYERKEILELFDNLERNTSIRKTVDVSEARSMLVSLEQDNDFIKTKSILMKTLSIGIFLDFF